MALLNGLYVFVQDEEVKSGVTTMTHPVEEGIEITDHVSKEPQVISLSGKIVGNTAAATLSKLKQWEEKGELIVYVGRNYASNYQIVSMNTSHPNTVHGGCDFSMELREVRIAKSPYKLGKDTAAKNKTPLKSVTKTGMQQKQTLSVAAGVYHDVKRGETAWSIANKYGAQVADIIKNNPDATNIKGDWSTLKIGAKILIGDR